MKTAAIHDNIIDLRDYRIRPKTDVREAVKTAAELAERIVNSLSAVIMAVCLTVCTLLFFTML